MYKQKKEKSASRDAPERKKKRMEKEERYTAERGIRIEVDMSPLHSGGMPLPGDAVRFADSELIPAVMSVTDVPALVTFRDESCAGQTLRNGLVRYRIRGSIVLSDMPVSSQEEAEGAADRMASAFMREKNCLLSYSIVSASMAIGRQKAERKGEDAAHRNRKKEEGKKNAGYREDVAR